MGNHLLTHGGLTLADIERRHPWPDELRRLARPLEFLWQFDVAAAPQELWRHLIDTSRFNRAIGLSPMQFDERAGVLHGRARNAGFLQEWIEVPWDWVAGRYLLSLRRYSKGFGHAVRAIYTLDDLPATDGGAAGSRLHVYFGWLPRSVLGATVLRLGMKTVESGYRRVLDGVAKDIASARPVIYQLPAPVLPPERAARLETIRAALLAGALPAAVVTRLIDHVAGGDDMELARIQVRERARAWGVDERELLRVCLHATRAGLLALSWDIVCPHCRGVSKESATLSAVPGAGRCELCAIDFATDQQNAVEVSFHVHPSIREVPRLFFCSAEPSSKAHIKVQRALGPGERAELTSRLPPGRYRLRLHGQRIYGFLDVDDAATGGGVAAADVAIGAVELAGAAPPVRRAAVDPVLRLHNDSAEPCTFVVEDSTWRDTALRPADLFTFQEFRDLFSEEYLGADVQINVGEQTILFTDMIGSTQFYALRGDPGAFIEIKRHFNELFALVEQHRGAVIKTIGDAVMAAFVDPVQALACARDIHRCFHASRADTPIRLRVTLNTGPCIAVKLNANIDYFGGTVNISAKLQSLTEAGEIALSASTFAAPGVADWLRAEGATLEELEYCSSALPTPVQVLRWSTFGPRR